MYTRIRKVVACGESRQKPQTSQHAWICAMADHFFMASTSRAAILAKASTVSELGYYGIRPASLGGSAE
jgi:hypothetical protein